MHLGGGKKQGIAIIYVALSLVVLLGVAALAIDIGFLYERQTFAQRAADAAALAAALKLPDADASEIPVLRLLG